MWTTTKITLPKRTPITAAVCARLAEKYTEAQIRKEMDDMVLRMDYYKEMRLDLHHADLVMTWNDFCEILKHRLLLDKQDVKTGEENHEKSV